VTLREPRVIYMSRPKGRLTQKFDSCPDAESKADVDGVSQKWVPGLLKLGTRVGAAVVLDVKSTCAQASTRE
jgi:hypothetical protein